MRIQRGLSLSLLSVAATAWAAVLSLLGLWLLVDGPSSRVVMLPMHLRVMLALAALAAGQIVFMCLVADRLVPGVNRGVIGWLEIAACAVLFISLVFVTGFVVWMYLGSTP